MKKLFVETMGCQMNVRDSEHMIAELTKKENYTLTQNPQEADLILINTCSVREKPVQKLFSEIGQFDKIRKKDSKLGVCGCTASHMGEEIIKKAPSVSFVLGARNVSKITEVIHKDKAVETAIDYDETTYIFEDFRSTKYKAYINIMTGCDKKCTFCIVPKTRGKELSVPKEIILSEAKKAVKNGAKEIVLLGQNVNAYGKRFGIAHEKINFTQLLRELSEIEGLEIIRFTSPYPQHADDEFIEEFKNNPKIAKHIHFPLQSGSNKILKLMKRGYTKEWFLDRIEKLREVENVSISTDIIVGFPYEDEEDFLETLDVIKKAKFEQIFSFVYSPRPLTEAEKMPQVDKQIAKERLFRLQELHKNILDEVSQKHIGKNYKVLFEEFDEKNNLLIGKSNNFFTVKAKGNKDLIGQILNVKINEAKRHALFGEII